MLAFCGPSYTLANYKASAQQTVNMYLVGMETAAKAQFILDSVPGLVQFADLGAPIRGCLQANNRAFFVAGPTLYELSAGGAVTARGTLSTISGPVDMAWGTTQLVMVDGAAGYVLTLSSNVFGIITDADFYPADRVAYLDGFFVFNRGGTQQFFWSAIDNATNLNGLDFASAESSPDKIVAIISDHRELWMLGEQSTEVWYTSGGADAPFARNNGANIEVGCIAAQSAQKIDNGIMWIGRDRNGAGMVYRSSGYQPQIVSTQAISEALQASTNLAAAVAYVYQDQGRTFWCVNAPGLTSTWCFEASTGAWHERCDLDAQGLFAQGRASHHLFAFDSHLMGAADGKVYRLDRNTYTNGADVLKRRRTSPNDIGPMMERVPYSQFVADLRTGGAGQGIAPQCELAYSNDGGQTFGAPVMRSIGRTGEYLPRVKWTRLGMARDRVWRLECSANAPFAIINAVAA